MPLLIKTDPLVLGRSVEIALLRAEARTLESGTLPVAFTPDHPAAACGVAQQLMLLGG